MKLSRSDIHRGHLGSTAEKLHRLEAKEERKKLSERRATKMLIGAAETFGTAGILGVVHGRMAGMPSLMNIPLDGAVGAVGTLGGAFGVAGKYSDDLFFVGLGAGSYFTGWLGIGAGQKWRDKAGELKGGKLSDDDAKKKHLTVRTLTAGQPRQNFAQRGGFVGAAAR